MEVFKIFNKEADFYNQIDTIYQNWNAANKIPNKKRNHDTRGKFLKEYLSFLDEDRNNIKAHYASRNQYHLENKRIDDNTITENYLRSLFKNLHIHYKYIEEFDYSSIPNIDFRKGVFHDFIYSNYDDFLEYFQSDYIDWISKNGYKNASKEDYRLELIKIYKDIVIANEKSEFSIMFEDDCFLYNKIIRYLTLLRFNEEKERQETVKVKNDLEIQQKKFLKDLFKEPVKGYNKVLELLIENKFVTNNSNETLSWNGCLSETSIEPLKLLGTLGVVLKMKNYLNSSVNKKQIAEALTNTFTDFNVSAQYYGKIEKSINNRDVNSKEADYYNSLHFIQSL